MPAVLLYKRSIRLLRVLLFLGGCLTLGFPPECWPANALGLSTHATQDSAEEGLEYELLALTNQQRVLIGIQGLMPDETLTQIAREHSLGMARQGFISHDLPSGDLRTRMGRTGYQYAIVRENVASSSTVAYVQRALMNSLVHKDNILAADVDRVGIGIIRGAPPYERELYITEIFASLRQDYKPDEVYDALLNRVHELRQIGAGALVQDPLLEQLASFSVELVELPIRREEIRILLANSAEELHRNGRGEIARLDATVQLIHYPKSLNIPKPFHMGQDGLVFGAAVRQFVDSANQPAFLVLTLIGFTN
jgi:hypothetical protein